MARHNYIIQMHKRGPNNGILNGQCGGNSEWRDCGTGNCMDVDQFGNQGYPDIDEAREDLDRLRAFAPNEKYRLIQIVS